MARKLIIDGSAVYELDEACMLKKQEQEQERSRKTENKPKNGKSRQQ